MVYHSPYDNWVVLSPIYPKQQVLFYCSIGVLKSFQIQLQEKNMETSNPLNLMIKRELHLAIRRQSQNDTWDANPSHPMPLACWTALQMYNIFLSKIHRSWALICYLWRNKRPPEKNHLLETWFRLWDRHRPCWGPAWDDNEAHSETWKCHPWRVPRWATCCLGFLKKDFDPTRIVCFNILKLALTFYSYSLFTMEIYNHSAQVHTLQTKLLFLSRIMVSKAFCQMLWKPWSSGPWFSGVANLRSDSRSRYPTCTDSPLPFQGKRLQRGNATTKINWVWVGGKEIQSTQHLVLILLHVRFTHKRFTQLSFSQDRLIFNHNIN